VHDNTIKFWKLNQKVKKEIRSIPNESNDFEFYENFSIPKSKTVNLYYKPHLKTEFKNLHPQYMKSISMSSNR